MPMRSRGPSAAAAGAVLANSKYSVQSTEENMEKFREEIQKGLSQIPASPKGDKKWGRLKQRVQWQEGDSCAVCMKRELTGRVKPCGHRSMCETCYNEVLSEGRGVYCPSCFSEVERLLPDSIASVMIEVIVMVRKTGQHSTRPWSIGRKQSSICVLAWLGPSLTT